LVGSTLLAVSFTFFTRDQTAGIYGGAALLAVGNGLMWPSLLALLSKTADSSVQGAVQGFAGSSSAVASIAGLIVGGLLYGVLNAGVFLLASALTAGVVVLSFALPRSPSVH
jgi:MFS family permease